MNLNLIPTEYTPPLGACTRWSGGQGVMNPVTRLALPGLREEGQKLNAGLAQTVLCCVIGGWWSLAQDLMSSGFTTQRQWRVV